MKATKMIPTIEIKSTLATLGIFCMACTGQGFAAEKPANPPAAPAKGAAPAPAPDPAREALASLCQVLLSSNRFLYLE